MWQTALHGLILVLVSSSWLLDMDWDEDGPQLRDESLEKNVSTGPQQGSPRSKSHGEATALRQSAGRFANDSCSPTGMP